MHQAFAGLRAGRQLKNVQILDEKKTKDNSFEKKKIKYHQCFLYSKFVDFYSWVGGIAPPLPPIRYDYDSAKRLV